MASENPQQSTQSQSALLDVNGVTAGYGETTVLEDVSLAVQSDSIISLIGRNGAGKTTTLKTIMGHISASEGTIRFNDEDITNQPPEEIYHRGIGLVPEHREVFPDLTVEENLKIGGLNTDRGWFSLEEAYEYFPRLGERTTQKAGTLSGGEQQMLAIARSLMGETKLLLLDEPTEGLAPQIVEDIIEILERLAADGITVLFVEQNIEAVMTIAEYHYLIADGTIVFNGSTDALEAADEVRQRYLGITQGV